ncbi:uncharacterized protein METZ01_LOCUS320668, partial [marine metagenome]
MSGNVMFRWFLQVFFLISIFCSGCAFIPRDVNIDIVESSIAYPRESLSSQYYINFEPLKDLRPDKKKLGVGRNKLMMVTTFVTVTGNVKSLFEKIVKQNFAAAGLGPGPSPFTVKTELIQAYTDLPGPNDVYVQIKLSLTIVNSETNIPLFHKILKGYEAVPVAQLSNISHEQAFIGASNQISEQVFDVASRIRQTIENNGQRSIQAKATPPVRQPTPQPSEEQLPKSGSGFFISKMGHVITNAHVVHNCNKVTIGDNAD